MRLLKGRKPRKSLYELPEEAKELNKAVRKGRKAGSNRRDRRGRQISVLYLLPSVVGVLLFFVLPFLIVIYYSVIDNPISGEFVFFDNFVMVFNNAAFQQAAKNTLMFSATAVPLAVVLSMLLAMMLESKIPFKSQFRTFF